MALFRQRNRQTWQVRLWVHGRQRSVSTGTTDRAEAEIIHAQLAAGQQGKVRRDRIVRALDAILGVDDAPVIPDAGGLVLGGVWKAYLAVPDLALSAETMRKRRISVERFGRWLDTGAPGVVYAGQVTRQVAARWLDAVRKGGAAGKTCQNLRGDLAAVWSQLGTRYDLPNVWRDVPAPKARDGASGRAFTAAEYARILDAARVVGHDWEGVCVVGWWTGLRYGDVARLRWDQYRDGALWVVPLKTRRHAVEVCVPVHASLAAFLAGRGRDGQYVFPSHVARLKSSQRRGEFGTILQSAGVAAQPGEHLSFHCFRHSFRTRLSAAGVPDEVARRLGGWRSDVAERVYDHDTERLRRAVVALPAG